MNWPLLESFSLAKQRPSNRNGRSRSTDVVQPDAEVAESGETKQPHRKLQRCADPLRPEWVPARFVEVIPREFARRHLIVGQVDPQSAAPPSTQAITVVISESTNPAALHNAGVLLEARLEATIADAEAIARVIDEIYPHATHPDDNADSPSVSSGGVGAGDIERLLKDADRDLLSTEGKGPVIKLVDAILFEALGRSASDVHIQPLADLAQVRYRLDGVLHTVRDLPRSLFNPVISRIKVIGRMDIAERRIPQDGRASVLIGPRSIDLRISTLPTSFGERAVIRLLDNSNHLCDFEHLGMPPEVAGPYLDRAKRATGMILLTGPTGSGKTTTLYSTLRKVGSSETNIMTIEDPVEYELSDPRMNLAISQSQVNPRKGVTFATGLRHILRQDPDIIMVGEIRDGETARIAIQSSLTGHLVFSTLHTNDAPSAVTRLIDLGVEPYLVSASLSAALAQRLVRKLHSCNGQGCDTCLGTGFRGRIGLFELFCVDSRIGELIAGRAPLSVIRQAARADDNPHRMRTLKEDGERLVSAGITTMPEILRVVQGAGE